jgi:hypothetical protein
MSANRKDFELGSTLSRHPQLLTPVERDLCGSKIRAFVECCRRRGEMGQLWYCKEERARVRRCFEFYGLDLARLEREEGE